jgi:hypothetical protein
MRLKEILEIVNAESRLGNVNSNDNPEDIEHNLKFYMEYRLHHLTEIAEMDEGKVHPSSIKLYKCTLDKLERVREYAIEKNSKRLLNLVFDYMIKVRKLRGRFLRRHRAF